MRKDISRRQTTLHRRSPPTKRVPGRQRRRTLHRDTRRVPGSEDEGSNSHEGSVCSDDGLNEDDCCLSFDGDNIGMDVDNKGGSYASSGRARSEPNELIDCCVESDGNMSIGQESDGGWDDSGGGSSAQADY